MKSQLPAVAAVASWMEAFHMPMREIQKRFTKSDLFLMAWRSTEISAQMHLRSGYTPENRAWGREDGLNDGSTGWEGSLQMQREQQLIVLGEKLAPIIDKMVNERGEIDLRRLTGPEALRYMSALGIPIGGRALG